VVYMICDVFKLLNYEFRLNKEAFNTQHSNLKCDVNE
jgi:hypothetical protein